MRYLLDACYLLLLILFSPCLLYRAIRQGKYREGFAAKFFGRVPHRSQPGKCIWLHAVSVGEVNVLAPILQRLEEQHPHWVCVISTTTQTGYALARKRYAPRMVFYCPLDFSWAVRRAMKHVRPDLLVLAELELWPNLIQAARRQGAKVAVVNGRLSERSARGYGRIRTLARSLLQRLDLIAVQNQEYAQRFLDLGAAPQSVCITGSIKFDGAQTNRQNPRTRELAALAGIDENDVVFLAGSTQDPEELLALDAYRQLAPEFPSLRLIITPRHAERFESVADLLQRAGLPWQRRSRLESDGADWRARVLLVDAVGELAAWWGTAHIAYVGGSMGRRGGQNMIEPAAYGAAVSFGPRTENFRDIVALMLQRQAAVVVQDGPQLTEFVRRCLRDPADARQLGDRARQLVFEQLGAADRTCALLARLLGEPPPAAGGPA
jgi:3-deoxy-D-manno-octulosonic-acid transferase